MCYAWPSTIIGALSHCLSPPYLTHVSNFHLNSKFGQNWIALWWLLELISHNNWQSKFVRLCCNSWENVKSIIFEPWDTRRVRQMTDNTYSSPLCTYEIFCWSAVSNNYCPSFKAKHFKLAFHWPAIIMNQNNAAQYLLFCKNLSGKSLNHNHTELKFIGFVLLQECLIKLPGVLLHLDNSPLL